MDYEPLRQKLDEERQRVERELSDLRSTESGVRADGAAPESGGVGNHLADEGTQTFDLERSFAMQGNLESLLNEVQHALRKFETGTYGSCDECNRPIAYERLEALPHAALCIECKARQEKAAAR